MFRPYSSIISTHKDHIAYITLNRPGEDNRVNLQLAQEVEDICCRIKQDDSIYVVVLTGAGERAFCAGSELEQLIQTNAISISPLSALAKMNVARSVASISQPVIAAINGDALGQGLALALSCDLRLASLAARFGFPEVANGLMPGDGGTQRLSRIVGRGRALELILTAETISAEEALAIGLVHQVVAPGNLLTEVEALAQSIASKAPIALKYVKEAVNKGMELTLEQGLRLEADLYFLLHTTSDRTEGIKAFLEKRPPQFKGQ